MKKTWLLACLMIIGFTIQNFSAQSVEQYRTREEMPARYKWDLQDIYKDWQAWNRARDEFIKVYKAIEAARGSITEPEQLLKILKMEDDMVILHHRLEAYPGLMLYIDAGNKEAEEKLQEFTPFVQESKLAIAWIEPEIEKIPQETLQDWEKKCPLLLHHRLREKLQKNKGEELNEMEKKYLTLFDPLRGIPYSIFSALSFKDLKYPTVLLSNGEEITVNNQNYLNIIATDADRNNRKNAYEAYYGAYKNNINTFAAIYYSVLERDWAFARAGSHRSSLEAAAQRDNVSVRTYENLITTLKKQVNPLKKYHTLRAQYMRLDNYRPYDMSFSLFKMERKFTYEEAKEILIAAVKPLGSEYQKKMRMVLSDGWVDVYTSERKSQLAEHWCFFGIHPYILLNFKGTIDSIISMAHEAGHAVHHLLSLENQPFPSWEPDTQTTEIAAILSENLILLYLQEYLPGHRERLAVLENTIRTAIRDFYFQTQLADFEFQAHRIFEKGNPVTPDTLNGIMKEIYSTY